jgi:hypothetical protein
MGSSLPVVNYSNKYYRYPQIIQILFIKSSAQTFHNDAQEEKKY